VLGAKSAPTILSHTHRLFGILQDRSLIERNSLDPSRAFLAMRRPGLLYLPIGYLFYASGAEKVDKRPHRRKQPAPGWTPSQATMTAGR